MPTIKDVAREAGVSIATVSYVLNNKQSLVSSQTRQQVLEAIERIGYTPNITARNLKSSQTRLIGYAWHEIPRHDQANSVLDRFTYFLAQAAEAAGYHLLTFTHPIDDPNPVYNELIRTQRVDAFVLAGTVSDDQRIRFLLKADFPFISFGRAHLNQDFPWVDTDGETGVREAVEYLISLGHRRIAMAAWPEESISGGFRVAGYMDALTAASLPFRPDYIIRGEHSEQAGREALAYWLTLPPEEQPTAVVAITDLVAVGVMNAAREHGLVVGRDLSVIGFDDAPMAQYLQPGLTTLRQAIPETGQALIAMLENVINKDPLAKQHILIPPSLIIRDSCAPPLND
ncbi:MAG: LacI family DNA-binding transcriptional regulator [Anaerolineae bacterium]|nr:LacI family DNA-binding transcriptional regulator [Anaerolineae bacterium]